MEIERSTFCQSFSTYMSYKRMMILTCNRFVQLTMRLIYSPNLFQLQLLRSCCTRSRCKGQGCSHKGKLIRVVLLFPYKVLSHWVSLVRFLMRQPKCVLLEMCTLFPSLDFFSYWGFSSKVLTRHIIYLDIQGGVL